MRTVQIRKGWSKTASVGPGPSRDPGPRYDSSWLVLLTMSLNDNAKLIGVYSDHPVNAGMARLLYPRGERVAEEVPVKLVYNGLPHAR
jgi:hypothetical protein